MKITHFLPVVFIISFLSSCRWNLPEVEVISPWKCGDLLVDNRDSRTYRTVQIGDQCWMAQNLNYGEQITSETLSVPADNQINKYCPEDNSSNCEFYGGLYLFEEIYGQETDKIGLPSIGQGPRGICPEGWHLPDEVEREGLCMSMFQDEKCNPPIKPEFASIDFADIDARAGAIHIFTDSVSYPRLRVYSMFWVVGVTADFARNNIVVPDSDGKIRIFTRQNIFYLSENKAFCVRCIKD